MIGIEGALNSFSGTIIDRLMKAIWAAAMWLLRTAFELMDSIGGFRDGSTLVDGSGRPSPAAPFFALWPTLLWIGGSVAVGLFLWQLTLTMVRGGAGFWRVASGPAAYGVATALTLGVVAALVGASEGLTALLLQRGLAAENFRTILDHPSLGFSDSPVLDSSLDATARALLLGMIALFGVLPAAVGFLLQMLFRQAVIVVLIATVPITAAGLLANSTAAWFWRSLRWMLAAILMKPALALVLVVGVNMLSGPTGIGGLFAGAGVLLISLWCPLVLFRLLAFVEQGGRYAAAGRANLAASAGLSLAAVAASHSEQVNTARFDAAAHTVPVGAGRAAANGAGPGNSGPLAARAARGRAETGMDATGVGDDAGARVAPGGTAPSSAGTGQLSPVAQQLPVGRRPGRAAGRSHPPGPPEPWVTAGSGPPAGDPGRRAESGVSPADGAVRAVGPGGRGRPGERSRVNGRPR